MALLQVIDDIMHYIDRHISCSEVYDDLMQSPRSAYADSHSHLHKHTEGGPASWSTTSNPSAECNPDLTDTFDSKEEQTEEEEACDLDINYSTLQPSLTSMLNDGHTIKLNVPATQNQCVLKLYDKEYTLTQAHFYAPSEHIDIEDGDHYPMEMHLVHQNDKDESVAVIGFFFETNQQLNNFDALKQEMDDSKQELMLENDDSDRNEFLAQFWDYLPQKDAEMQDEKTMSRVAVENEISFLSLFRSCMRDKEEQQLLEQTQRASLHLDMFYYEGSLTAPPRTEGVQWMIIKKPQLMSLKQLVHLRQRLNPAHDGDAKPKQHANGRIVHLVSRVQFDTHK